MEEEKKAYPRIYPTVDVALIFHDKILLGRKKHQDKFRFIGGFVNIEDISYEIAAIREVKEETGYEISDLKYICSQTIFDPRFDNITEGIKTTLYMAEVYHWNAVPDDDIVECKWFTINDLNIERDFVEEHQPIAQWFIYWVQAYLRNERY
jgi:bifunctional NMN adenylyltransferase/nudix hydrolase